jgi:hypothetical protein
MQIQSRGYSELSLTPLACSATGPFNALGGLPCRTPLYIRNPQTHQGVEVRKQDNGCGSTFNSSNPDDWATMGLYPDTVRDLGLQYGLGRHRIHIARPDGSQLNVQHGTPTTEVSAPAPATVPTVQPKQLYFDPLKSASVTAERIDDGVDYAGTGYYDAIADCVVTSVRPGGWAPYGNFIEYKITQDGPLKDVYVYYAEGVDNVVNEGDTVGGGEHICKLIPGWHSGTEIGFAAGNGISSWASVYGGGHHTKWETGGVTNVATASGVAFSRLIQRLGGTGGRLEGPIRGTYPPWTQSGQIPSAITPAPTTPTGGTGATGAPTNAQVLAQAYRWPNDYWNAFWELHQGMGEASHHSHSALAFAQGVKYRTTKV